MMENENLRDDHEALLGEVKELRRIVADVKSICLMDKSIKSQSNPDAILVVIQRELEW